MDRWDWILVAIAGYLAVMSLVRLMAHRRNQLLSHFHGSINNNTEQQEQGAEEPEDQSQDAA